MEHVEIARGLYNGALAFREYIALVRTRRIPYECHYGVEGRVEVGRTQTQIKVDVGDEGVGVFQR